MTKRSTKKRKWRTSRTSTVTPGSPPGQLVARDGAGQARLRILAYGPDGIEEREASRVEDVQQTIGRWPTTWIDVQGVADVETVSALGDLLGLHRLALEDVVNLGQRAKVDDYETYLFIVARAPTPVDDPAHSEQISMFVGPGYVVTFQEREGDPFDGVRERIRAGKGRIRSSGPDYLTYALLDAVIDANFPIVEDVGHRLESIERRIVEGPDEPTVGDLLRLRSEMLTLRRDLLPHRDMLQSLIRGESPLCQPSTAVFLRDCADHIDQLNDLLVVYREVSSDLMALHVSSVSNRMNEVMKVLTMVATVFIPLSFVAGVYGMNFDPDASRWNMPELGWAFGYPAVLLLMLAIAAGMLVMFRRMGWLGGRPGRGVSR